ncbi:MAG: toll/interleukin-1 receptor domain-containing protein [Candidatus Methylophosphatis roskildensis]
MKPFAFISYRRADSSTASRWIANRIENAFGSGSAFIDTETIRASDDWPQRIDAALSSATLLIVVIGNRWLSLTDEHHRRRIDDANDWVHKEIAHGLNAGMRVLPVLVHRAIFPSARALPRALSKLATIQAIELREERWDADISALIDTLSNLGFTSICADQTTDALQSNHGSPLSGAARPDRVERLLGLQLNPTLTLPSNTPLGKPHGTRHSATTPKSVCI